MNPTKALIEADSTILQCTHDCAVLYWIIASPQDKWFFARRRFGGAQLYNQGNVAVGTVGEAFAVFGVAVGAEHQFRSPQCDWNALTISAIFTPFDVIPNKEKREQGQQSIPQRPFLISNGLIEHPERTSLRCDHGHKQQQEEEFIDDGYSPRYGNNAKQVKTCGRNEPHRAGPLGPG